MQDFHCRSKIQKKHPSNKHQDKCSLQLSSCTNGGNPHAGGVPDRMGAHGRFASMVPAYPLSEYSGTVVPARSPGRCSKAAEPNWPSHTC